MNNYIPTEKDDNKPEKWRDIKEIITQAHMAGQMCADPDIGNPSFSDAHAYYTHNFKDGKRQPEQEEKSCKTCIDGPRQDIRNQVCYDCGNKMFLNWKPKQEQPAKCIICDKQLTQKEVKVYQCSCGAMEKKYYTEFVDSNIKVNITA